MNIIRVLAIMVAVLSVSATAQAANIGLVTPASVLAPISGGNTPLQIDGTLQSGAEVTFDYIASGPFISGTLTSSGQLGGGLVTTSSSTGGGVATSGALPVITMAYMNPGAVGIGTVTFANLSGSDQSFSAIFKGLTLGQFGSATVFAVVSAVPLSSAFIFFVTGLLALAGFAAYRKNNA